MSEIKVRNNTGIFGACCRRGCTTQTSRIIEVIRDDERKLHHVCGHDQSAYSIKVDDALDLIFTPRHSPSHAKMGEVPVRVSFRRDEGE